MKFYSTIPLGSSQAKPLNKSIGQNFNENRKYNFKKHFLRLMLSDTTDLKFIFASGGASTFFQSLSYCAKFD